MKAGKYYLGDPCYFFPHDEEGQEAWGDFLDVSDCGRNNSFVWKGHSCFVGGTAYGDGVYSAIVDGGLVPQAIPVDAGLVGCFPFGLVEKIGRDQRDAVALESKEHLCIYHDFPEEFYPTCDNGVFEFGNVVIDTLCEDEAEEGEEEEW